MSTKKSVRQLCKRITKTGLERIRPLLERFWKYWVSQVRLLFDLPGFLIKTIRAVLAAALAATASFEVVLFSKDDISFFRAVEVAFLSGYVAVNGHYTKM
jgi:hypothetical protein